VATPEQEAFIHEMMHKKPGEVWKELWEARQALKGVGTPEVLDGVMWRLPNWAEDKLGNIPQFGAVEEEADDNDEDTGFPWNGCTGVSRDGVIYPNMIKAVPDNSYKVFPKQEPTVFTYPEGTWHPLPVEMYDQPMEYMKVHSGLVYIRPIEERVVDTNYVWGKVSVDAILGLF
jgi:hypothetical protein